MLANGDHVIVRVELRNGKAIRGRTYAYNASVLQQIGAIRDLACESVAAPKVLGVVGHG